MTQNPIKHALATLSPLLLFTLFCAACGGNTSSPPSDAGILCDGPATLCIACTADHQCPSEAPLCDTSTSRCVVCTPTRDGCTGGKHCALVDGAFACAPACVTSADCTGLSATAVCCAQICHDLTSDSSDCGGCGMACSAAPNAGLVCASSTCAIAGCAPGYADCDKVESNGCEASLHDLKNCGACGSVCMPANGNGVCTSGVCGLGSCVAGFGDCDKNAANGCEVDLSSSLANCGGCGKTCALANATSICAKTVCFVSTCNAGFLDCDGTPANGCETNAATDVSNCGACKNACNGANAKSTCTAGACAIVSCSAGYSDCDQSASNGCEADTMHDTQNCGACGTVCPAAEYCVAGACAVSNPAVLVLGDDQAAANNVLVAALNQAGLAATLVANGGINYTGTPSASNFGAVVILVGNNFTDMPLAGQQAIVSANAGPTGVVFTEFAAFQVSKGRWASLSNLVLLAMQSSNVGISRFTLTLAGHPVWTNLPHTFLTVNQMGTITGAYPINGGTEIATCADCQGTGVAVRDSGNGNGGRIVHSAFAADYNQSMAAGDMAWSNDPNITLLMINSVKWAVHAL